MTHINLRVLALTVNLTLISFLPVQAQPVTTTNTKQLPINQVSSQKKKSFVKPTPGQGAPRRRKPAGSRGCSVAENKPFTPLLTVSQDADGKQLVWGITTQDRPKFWFHVPFEGKSITKSKFSLRDSSGNILYETELQLNNAPGIVSISLPENIKPLEVENWYQSYLFIYTNCSDSRKVEMQEASGWVKREAVSPQVKNLLDKASSPVVKAMLYSQNGIWIDALTILGELRRDRIESNEWKELLESENLGSIAGEKIIEIGK